MRFTLLILLGLFALPLAAQEEPSKWRSQPVVINNPDVTVKAMILMKEKPMRAKDDLTYSWFKSGKIVETQGGNHGRLLDGNYAEFYLNHQLKTKGNFKLGLKHGEWRQWFENGKLKQTSSFKKGRLTGELKQFDADGNLVSLTHFKKGEKHGFSISYANGVETGRQFFWHDSESEPRGLKYKLNKGFKKNADAEADEPEAVQPPVRNKVKRTRTRTSTRNTEQSEPEN